MDVVIVQIGAGQDIKSPIGGAIDIPSGIDIALPRQRIDVGTGKKHIHRRIRGIINQRTRHAAQQLERGKAGTTNGAAVVFDQGVLHTRRQIAGQTDGDHTPGGQIIRHYGRAARSDEAGNRHSTAGGGAEGQIRGGQGASHIHH